MVLQSEIERSFTEQQLALERGKTLINRTYLNNFKIHPSHIEVITGIRRCGKSTLLKQIINKYYQNVAWFNFEDSRIFGFELTDFQKLDQVMGQGKQAYFFDEIQNVPSWEIFVRQLHDRGEKVFVTGSNASLLSKELGTRLTGRNLRHELFPFSFSEYLSFINSDSPENNFSTYLTEGGLPEYLQSGNKEVLQTLLRDIVLRDIVVRYGIRNPQVIMSIALFLASNVGKEISFNSIRNSFSVGSVNTVSDYLAWLEDAYLFFFLPRFSWSAKAVSVNARKVYGIDAGLVNANSLSFSGDRGRLLENIVYLHLRQKGYNLFYFREKRECDFLAFEEKKIKYVLQVCEEISNDNLKRETEGLVEALQFFKFTEGTIVTKKQADVLTIEGFKIKLIPAHSFLLEIGT
jgi:predicted AAA+ superfamily ATPase